MKGINAIMIGCIACLAFFCLSKCSNELEVQREYAYEVSTWPLPAEVAPGEEVEIRFTLEREGDYAGAEYGFSWVQTDGKGTLRDSRGMYYTDREEYELRVVPDLDVSDPLAWRFTLWYRPTGSDDLSLRFIVTDNFGQQQEAECSFRLVESDDAV